ncbi:MAG: hypothetical protein HPY83_11435 [Anaerolineae bacterium]|nr:hypothetical protein [Anaerolineae bacterium]
MSADLAIHLERLEHLVDPERARANERLQEDAWAFRPVPRIPCVLNYRDKVSKERKAPADWPVFPYAEIFRSPEKMLLDELEDVYVGALLGDDKVYTVRANYGVGILPSVFGCEIHAPAGNDLPWVEPLSPDEVRRVASSGPPDLDRGLFARALETEQFFIEALAPYPRLSAAVRVGQADLQGPMNVAAEVMGPDVYTAVYDDPILLHELLGVVTESIIAGTLRQKEIIGEERNRAYHWHFRVVGGVRISEDFALSLSPRHYAEFAVPYNARVYEAFGGGYLLHADEGLPAIRDVLDTPGITGLYRWTEKAEEFDVVWPLAQERGVCLIWNGPLPEGWRERADTGLILEAIVSGPEEGRRRMATAGRELG